jgi:hypothetical protein
MNNLTVHGVVDRMAADLAERRHNTIHRNSAYVALARAILSDEQSEQPALLAAERYPASIGSQSAA